MNMEMRMQRETWKQNRTVSFSLCGLLFLVCGYSDFLVLRFLLRRKIQKIELDVVLQVEMKINIKD